MSTLYAPHGDAAWRQVLANIVDCGTDAAPRGQPTKEILHVNHCRTMMECAIVTSPARKLNYKFMAAEALWILSGSNRLEPLTRFVKRMADFSDDGVTLSGAYGPPIVDQLSYVIRALTHDRDTRQAVLTTWRPRPGPSKDIPCTVAMSFSIREDRLHQHVFMRSSDAWLGIPYDMFSFACVGLKVACEHNRLNRETPVLPGVLTISATSSHLYTRDLDAVRQVLESEPPRPARAVSLEAIREGAWSKVQEALSDYCEGRTNAVWDLRGEL